MNAHGRMIRIDSKPAPPVTPAQRAEMDIIGELAIHNINLSHRESAHLARIEELEAALGGILAACDNTGKGFSEAIQAARAVMRR